MGLGEFLFKIRGDTTQFASSLGGAVGAINKFGGAFAGVFQNFILPYVGASAIRRQAAWADDMVDLAKATGLTLKQLQELEYTASESGSTLTDYTRAVRYLASAQVAAARGSKEYQAIFERFDIPDYKSITAAEALYRIFAKMKGANVTSQTRDDLQKILGRASQQLIPGMVAGMDAFANAANAAGMVVEDSIVKRLADANDRMARLMMRARALGVPLIEKGLTGLEYLSKGAELNWAVTTGKMTGKEAEEAWDKWVGENELMRQGYEPPTGPRADGGDQVTSIRKAGTGLALDQQDQWARMGLYVTTGQLVYQRRMMSLIQTLVAQSKQISKNTADQVTATEEL